jgi:hypothetical protein
VFLVLAWWNGVVAVLFGVGVLAYVLTTLYWKFGGEPFDGAVTQRSADIYGDARKRD